MVKKQTTLQSFRTFWLAMLAITALLAACAPAQPTQSAQDIQAQIQTSVALTVDAQNAQTAQAQPAATQADTPTAALTFTPMPTLTPVIVPTFTSAPVSSGGGGGGGGGGSVAPLAYSCGQEDWRPLDYTVFYAGESFSVKFRLKNTGTQQWCESQSCSGGPDLTFVSGDNWLKASSIGNGPLQVPALKPGELSSQFGPYSAVAPSKRGTSFMVWKLQDMQNSECLQFVIIVK